jgi:hypothetical protein
MTSWLYGQDFVSSQPLDRLLLSRQDIKEPGYSFMHVLQGASFVLVVGFSIV